MWSSCVQIKDLKLAKSRRKAILQYSLKMAMFVSGVKEIGSCLIHSKCTAKWSTSFLKQVPDTSPLIQARAKSKYGNWNQVSLRTSGRWILSRWLSCSRQSLKTNSSWVCRAMKLAQLIQFYFSNLAEFKIWFTIGNSESQFIWSVTLLKVEP